MVQSISEIGLGGILAKGIKSRGYLQARNNPDYFPHDILFGGDDLPNRGPLTDVCTGLLGFSHMLTHHPRTLAQLAFGKGNDYTVAHRKTIHELKAYQDKGLAVRNGLLVIAALGLLFSPAYIK